MSDNFYNSNSGANWPPVMVPYGEAGFMFMDDVRKFLEMFGAIASRVTPEGEIEVLVDSDEGDGLHMWVDITEVPLAARDSTLASMN